LWLPIGLVSKGSWRDLYTTYPAGLYIFMQAGLYLAATRGFAAPEALICYERAEPLCRSLGRPLLLSVSLTGQWRYSLNTDKLTATMRIADRIYSLAQEQKDAALKMGAYRALACTLYYLGEFTSARQNAWLGVEVCRSEKIPSYAKDPDTPPVACLCYLAGSEWHLGEIAASQSAMAEAIFIANEVNDMHALALALYWAARLAFEQRNISEVERSASDLIELSTRQNFVFWLATGEIYRGWARSVSGNTAEGIPWIEQGIRDFRATGAVLALPVWLAQKAEALHLADRTREALDTVTEAEAMAERFEQRFWLAELRRLRGLFLAASGAPEYQIEASFTDAVKIAKEQKSISLVKRAESTLADYLRRKTEKPGRPVRLPL
jgi:adenylate cyclase